MGGDDDSPDRLQKVLAHAGVGSRRACEELILQGRVTVDGKVVRELGTRVDAQNARIAVDGQAVRLERNVYFAVHKPKGYVSTNSDPAGKPRVVDLIPEIPQRVYTVGRLDEQSTGLLLLTNDGELANRLAHPRFGVEKIYRVVVAGEPTREVLQQLTEGIWLAEGKVRAKRIRIVGRKGQATVLEMVLAEGKNREIRRMLARMGHKVMSLTRIAVGPIGLKGLGVGECRPLTAREIELLRQVAAGIPVAPPRSPDRRERTPRPTGKRPQAERQADRVPPPPPPPRPAVGPGRPAMQGQAEGHRPRPPRPQGPPGRPAQGPGHGPAPAARRPPQGQGHGPVGRPPQGQGQRPAGRPLQGQGHGPVGRPPQGQGQRPAGPPPRGPRGNATPPPPAPRRPVTSQEDQPTRTRKIIGMEPSPASSYGAAGGRARRPAPKRAPRAALGVRRPPRKNDSDDASND